MAESRQAENHQADEFDAPELSRIAPPRSAVAVLVYIGLAAALAWGIVTRSLQGPSHLIFLLMAVSGMILPFRKFAIRLVLGMAALSALALWSLSALNTSGEELAELVMFGITLLVIFRVARARDHAADDRKAAYEELTERTDAELEDLRRRLVHSQRLDILGRTSAGLAHDLRNVFTIIEGYSSEFHDSEDPSVIECAAEVSHACDRGKSLVNEILWVGRQHHTAATVIDLGAAVTELGPILQRLTGHRVSLTVRAPSYAVPVRVDKMSITQILMNLVANANDAIGATPGRITVAVNSLLTNNPEGGAVTCAVLSVTDDGCGFNTTSAQHAFAAEFTTKGSDHSGLGLYTVAQLADRCGGSVRIESGDGAKTVVSVTMPVDELAPSPAPAVGDDFALPPPVCPDQIVTSAPARLGTDDRDTTASRSTSHLI